MLHGIVYRVKLMADRRSNVGTFNEQLKVNPSNLAVIMLDSPSLVFGDHCAVLTISNKDETAEQCYYGFPMVNSFMTCLVHNCNGRCMSYGH